MDLIIEELNKLIINARKSKGRKYTKETIKEKYHLITEYSRQFGQLASHLPDPLRSQKIAEFKAIKTTATELLKEHSSLDQNSLNMSSFDSKKASDTIPIFDGKHAHLDIFLSMVEMVHDELNELGKKNLIKYVTAIKLNDRVRNILLTKGIPTTFDELKSQLSTNFKPIKTASSLHSEIRSIKQKGNVSGFKEKIDKLISELTLVQYTDLEDSSNEVARSTIRMMNEKLALETFQEGLQENIRIAVVAAQPKTLIQAYEIASTQERLLQTTNRLEIFHISNNNRHNYNTNNNYNSNNNQRTNRYNNNNNNRYNNRNRNFRNYNNNDRNFNIYNRNPNNTNSRYNTSNAHNRNNRSNHNNNNHSNQRNNNYNNNPNVRTINQQGNGETLETQNESPERENYRFTQ